MHEDTERCVRAVASRDARFDGWFFTGVRSTGIYCRPSCPAMTPKAANLRFYPSAAAAQQAGFRACKRCRPDATPGSPEWDHGADVVARAMRLVADGVVDRDGVVGLADRLGYSTRQVERHLRARLGAGPLALARSGRAQTARTLIETTDLPMADVAFAAGFASIRSFNDTVRAVFAATPTVLRAQVRPTAGSGRLPAGAGTTTAAGTPPPPGTPPATAPPSPGARPGAISLRLPFRGALHAEGLFAHLVATAVPGVEEWRDGAYRRTLRLPHGHGIAALTPADDHIGCRLHLTDLRDLAAAISRCRRLLDLDADPDAVDAQLAEDPALTALVRAAPGRRVPRTVDGAELAVRAVLGQQVSTAAARTHAGRLVAAHGTPVADPVGGLTHLFPTPRSLASASSASLALPSSRRVALQGLVTALADENLDLGPGGDWDEARRRLAALPGLGPWTVELIAMRALGDPDAFLPTDLGVRSAAERLGMPKTPAAFTRRAAVWRPWRAYAVQHLLATSDHPTNRLPATAAAA